ncbi:MAG: preprotein translocase subunit SecG [Pyrinomonadaceae bacterium]|nr:preprotein translocase subunit SecG [Pyrinomonadaceae bacterium]
MLTYTLYGLFILACVILIIAVLLQPGKADAGALFTSSVSSTAFGPRGTQTLLAKITIGAAAAFMLVALTLSLPALTGERSVLQSQPETSDAPQASPSVQATPQNTASPQGESNAPATNSNTANQPTPSPSNNLRGQTAPANSPAPASSPR